ncbi:MAG: SLC13 family permease [Defluviitaleaceae bacterium]|nr:SLC13 family permease [Defluviitaleaceae bacterium]
MDTAVIALIIIGVALVLYITDIFPVATTSILAILAMVVFDVIPFSSAFGGFANDMVFLIIGMVIVGNTLFETGVAQILGKSIIKISRGNEKMFVVILILVATIPAAFLSNTAAAAMMIPVAASAVAASNGKFTKKNTFMVIGIAAVTSGGLTAVGSTPQLIARDRLIEAGIEPFGFFELAWAGAPVIILLLVYYLTIGRVILKKTARPGENLTADIPLDYGIREVERNPLKMAITLSVLVFCIVGFISDGFWGLNLSLGTISMIGAAVCIATKCIGQKRVFETMDWTTVVVIGASLGLSAGLDQSGAGAMVAEGMVGLLGDNVSPWLLTAGLALIAVILGNFMSSTATAALLIPISMSVAIEMGIDVKAVIMAVVIACNISYATPVSTPPMTMTLSAGYKFIDYIKFGGLFNLLAYALVVLLFPLILNI